MSFLIGEYLEIQLDDWLPYLERASIWNPWREDAPVSWSPHGTYPARIQPGEKGSFEAAVEALRIHLLVDPATAAVAFGMRHKKKPSQ